MAARPRDREYLTRMSIQNRQGISSFGDVAALSSSSAFDSRAGMWVPEVSDLGPSAQELSNELYLADLEQERENARTLNRHLNEVRLSAPFLGAPPGWL